MEVQEVLHMIGGEGDHSYAINSAIQRRAISKAKPVVKDTIVDLYSTTFPKSLGIADLGCSSGPNTLLVISEIIDTIHETCTQLSRPSPEFLVFLNDLPGNDFNTTLKSLPSFYEKLRCEKGDEFGPCFIAAVAGSFYGRLFPTTSLHFIHSSFSLHWLSQVPQGLETEMGTPLNKGNIYMAKTSPPPVFKAYSDQFQRDFSTFLRARSEELIPGGRMVLTLIGRESPDPSSRDCCDLWELLAQALNGMVALGLVDEAKVDSFDLPYYTPYSEELKAVIQKEGSFDLDRLEIIEVNGDDNDDDYENFVFDKFRRGRNVAKCIRSVVEPMLASHFGDGLLDDLFERYRKNVTDYLMKENENYINLVVSMKKRE
eukprot:TRINITY_DN5400_c0_g1_i1.p1 TRINITY_DN5400_c0_g1~~TRINITY_DN5400_c0_g1_i1.p1  ORF type:complete len:372 (-),score=59.99 TRINITY_DN5400_c0_g1_i1:770-1885(-)